MRQFFLSALALILLSSPAFAQATALSANQFMASPAGSSGFLSPRSLTNLDLPSPITSPVLTGNIGGAGGSLSVVDLYDSIPDNGTYFSSSGAAFSISPLGGHVAGDTLRTQLYIKNTTQTSSTQQEFGEYIDQNNHTGGVNTWLPLTVYPAGSLVRSVNNLYTYSTVSGGTSGNSGGPTCTGGTCSADGSITWVYQGAGINDGKTGLGIGSNMNPGAGQQWGQATALTINSGAFPTVAGGFASIYEMDLSQGSGRDCQPGIAGSCQVYGLFMAGLPTTTPGTVGMFLAGADATGAHPMYHWGMYIGAGFAKDIGLLEASGAAIGTKEQGTNSAESLLNTATSPYGHLFQGSYSNAALDTTGATTSFSLNMADLQQFCLSPSNNCLTHSTGFGRTFISHGGGDQWQFWDNGDFSTARHFFGQGSAPVPTGCGSGSPSMSTGANDIHGTVTEGTSASGCTIPFATYTNPPDCTVTWLTGIPASFTYSTTTAHLVVVNTAASGGKFTYHCMGQ